jgi:Spy/CpxP family protein refolding chaperone
MKKAALITALALVAVTALEAQQGPPPGGVGQVPPPARPVGPPRDALMQNLFPPEMIMQNQRALQLTDEQRSYMMNEMQRTQQASQQIQWQLQAAMERLQSTVEQARVDERQALAALDSVLAMEREMKRLQITLLVRLKSRLTPEQQAFLRGRMSRDE